MDFAVAAASSDSHLAGSDSATKMAQSAIGFAGDAFDLDSEPSVLVTAAFLAAYGVSGIGFQTGPVIVIKLNLPFGLISSSLALG